ncbi:hypothetical protein [Bradyrhizobium sp. AUGA SZCCT0431]|uniref:hypothetical protein n=1 Tax=Bradyrhizobium sp. AUGA SZCCT0431 TaxID=2807674 RepID=UPI001BAC11A7|nr:hypothetical protein [Bradyrhizobium sp. AUGA SZCCT0431]MBR1147079.1 hypothetical protein [Bradyrhizobium sp. AUGA SZCCT0431]
MSDDNPFYGLMLFTGPGVLAYQGYPWLQSGIWTPLPISLVFDYFSWPHRLKGWIGLQSMIDWLLDCPLSLLVFLLSLVAIVIGAVAGAMIDRGRQSI